MYLGDFNTGVTIRGHFNTRTAAGTPITLAGTPALSVYKDGGTTESTTGVTLTVDFDSRTGLHLFAIDTSADGTFYSTGSDFRVVLTAGTVDSVSVVGAEVGSFSIQNRSALRPTVAGRTLDVSSGGEAGIDFANIGSPTTTVNLSGTTVKAVTDAVAVSDKTGFSLSAGGVTAVQSGLATQTSVDDIPTVSEFNARTLPNADYFVVGDYTAPPTANAIADQVWDEAQADHLTSGSMGKWINDIALYGSAVFSAMEIDGLTYRFTTNALELSPTGGSAPTAAAIADAVWDEAISGHLTSGSTGAALNAAGGSGDPWSSSLPGSYVAGQAGKMLSDINAKAALITSGSVQFTSMVNTDGYIDGDIIIGDDYLAANGRAFQWTFTPNSEFVAATSSCKFGGSNADGTSTWLVAGTVTDNGNGTWTISFDLPLSTTSTLLEGLHDWSVECISVTNVEITKKRSGKKVKVVRKWT
jgi:hypothetical protein